MGSGDSEVIVFGGGGQLGRELARTPAPSGWMVRSVPRAAVDVTDPAAVDVLLAGVPRARAVVNAAAYTAVDRAEADRMAAFAVNAAGAENVAEAAAAHGLFLVHVSTDYVFHGESDRPWREDDPVSPLGVYGESKAAGEEAVRRICTRHAIVRTSWLFGAHGSNFVRTMLRVAAERDSVTVVDDQTGCPTWAGHLSQALLEMIAREQADSAGRHGTFHYAGAGSVTWCGFARAIFAEAGRLGVRVPHVEPIATSDYPTAARRPRYSVLATDRIGRAYGVVPRPWSEGLRLCLSEMVSERGA